jgi:hypothetical protein
MFQLDGLPVGHLVPDLQVLLVSIIFIGPNLVELLSINILLNDLQLFFEVDNLFLRGNGLLIATEVSDDLIDLRLDVVPCLQQVPHTVVDLTVLFNLNLK